MHHPDFCCCIYCYFCHLPIPQMAQEGMELWYQLGYLVCWLILWLRDVCSSSFICYSQVLLSTCWSGATVVPIRILSVHLHSSIGKVLTKMHIYLGITILLVYNCVPLWPIVKVAWDLAFSMGNAHWILTPVKQSASLSLNNLQCFCMKMKSINSKGHYYHHLPILFVC